MLSNIIFNLRLRWIKKQGERYRREKRIKDAYAKYWPEKKDKKVSNIMLVIIVIAIVGYFIANYILQSTSGVEISPTLTTCWFSFWGVEIVALAGIRVSKVIKDASDPTIIESQDNDAVG